MNYYLTEIFDISEIKSICKNLTQLTGIGTTMLDLEGKIYFSTGWQPAICAQFHKINSETKKHCTETYTMLAGQMQKLEEFHIYKCKNGLTYAGMPVIVEKKHVGNLFTGQFFPEKPDIKYFRKQAQAYKFNELKYLKAVDEVPIFSEKHIKETITSLVQLIETIGNIGLKNLTNNKKAKQLANEKRILKEKKEEYATISQQYKAQNEELIKTQYKLKKAQEVTHFGDWELNLANHKLSWSDEIYRIFDLKPQAIKATYEAFLENIHPDDRQKVDKAYTDSLKNKIPYEINHRILSKSGKIKYISEKCNIVYDESGKPVRSTGMLFDITNQEEVKQELLELSDKHRESELLYKSVFIDNSSISLIIDPENGKIVDANKAASSFYRYPVNEMTMMNISEIDLASKREIYKEMQKAKMSKKKTFYFKHKLANNELKYVEVSTRPIVSASKTLLFYTVHDITKHIKVDRALKESDLNLKERIKELQGISSLGQLTEKNKNLNDIYREFVNKVVPKSMHFPEKVFVSLEVDNKIHCNIENYKLPKNKKYLSANIYAFRKQIGRLIITYTEDIPFIEKFEQNLTNIYAERLSKITERIKTQEALKETDSNLRERNKELQGIYSLGQITEKHEKLNDIYSEFVNEVVPLSMQFPDKVFVSLEVDNKTHCNIENYKLPKNKKYLSANIYAFKKKIGRLIIAYTEDLPFIEKFEQNLTNIYAIRLSKVTERIKTEENFKKVKSDLMESEEKYRILFESSREAIMLASPPDWYFTDGNSAAIEMFGAKDKEEFTSKKPGELSPEYQPDGQLSSKKARMMIEDAIKAGSNFFEWVHKRINGEEFPATVQLTRVELRNEKFVEATVRDITESKRTEEELIKHRNHLQDMVIEQTEELRKSELQFRSLSDNLPGVVYLCKNDKEFTIIYVNDNVKKVTGYTRKEFLDGKIDFDRLYHSDDRKKVYEDIDKALAERRAFHLNCRIKHKNGDLRYIEEYGTGVYLNNKLQYLEGFILDITSRVESEVSLKERAKELQGIASLGQLTEKHEELNDIYTDFVNKVVPLSMHFPDKVFVSLEVDNKIYCNIKNYKLPKNRKYLAADIYAFKKQTGRLIITYTEDLPFIENFEQNLTNIYAERLSKITERIKTREALEESEVAFKERAKELQGIASLGQLTEKHEKLNDIYTDFVNEVVPLSMQFPDKVFVSLEVDNKIYCNIENHKLPKSRKYLSANIYAFKKQIGRLIITYTEDLPFIKIFEQNLTDMYAERLSKITERIKARETAEKSEAGRIFRTVLTPKK